MEPLDVKDFHVSLYAFSLVLLDGHIHSSSGSSGSEPGRRDMAAPVQLTNHLLITYI